MFSGLPLVVLVLIFLAAAGVVWFAGIYLSKSTDALSKRLHLGEALGGLLLLAIATNLPELAITCSAALRHDLGIAIGNILGGIAIQTLVLVLLDASIADKPLTYFAASLDLVIEATIVIGVLGIALMGTQLPSSTIFARMTPGSIFIVILWMVGMWLVRKARTGLPWHEQGRAPGSQPARKGGKDNSEEAHPSMTHDVVVFALASVATLAAGIVLEESGTSIAGSIGLSGVLFGSTILAASTSLPEVSTGLASVRLGDYRLALSDIFGGNAFLPVLFLLADLLSGNAVLPGAHRTDIYLTSLGVLLTMVYIWGLIFRPQRQYFRLGPDSLAVLFLYVVGLVGLVLIVKG